MTTQTEAQRVKFATPDAGTTIEFRKALAMISDRDIEWQSITNFQQRTLEKMQDGYGARIAELEAANAELLDALKGVTQELLDVLKDINNDRVPFDGDEFHERLEAGKAAIAKHGGAA